MKVNPFVYLQHIFFIPEQTVFRVCVFLANSCSHSHP